MQASTGKRVLAAIVALGLSILGLAGVAPVASAAVTCDVTVTGGSIQAAIDAASPGATICVEAGTYAEEITIDSAVNLIGADPATTSIDLSGVAGAGNAVDVVGVTSGEVRISGFTIRTGPATAVGSNGIYVGTISSGVDVTIDDVVLAGRAGTTDYPIDNFPLYAANGSTGASLTVTGSTIGGGGDNTVLLEKWRGAVTITGNTIVRPNQDVTTSSLIFMMNYGGADTTGTQLIQGNTFQMGGGATRMDAITVASAFNYFSSTECDPANGLGTGGYADVRILDNTFSGMVSSSRGIILWNQSGALDGPITTVVRGNSFLGASANFGVRMSGVGLTTTIENNAFTGFTAGAPGVVRSLTYGCVAGADASGVTLRNNDLSAGVGASWSSGTGTLVAANNWWGSTSGPTGGQTAGSVTTAPYISAYTADPARTGEPGFWPTDVTAAFPPVAIGAGDPAPVSVNDPASGSAIALDFPDGTTAGNLTVQTLTEPAGDPAQGDFGDGAVLLDFTFDGTFSAPVQICLTRTSGWDGAHLYHFVGGAWQDITLPGYPTGTELCGEAASFSYFAAGTISPAIDLTADVANPVVGQPVGLDVTLTGLADDGAGGLVDPSGTDAVTFAYCYDALVAPDPATCTPTAIATATPDGGLGSTDGISTAAATWTPQEAGLYAVIAEYAGDAVYAAADDSVARTVAAATTTLLITTVTPEPSLVGDTYAVEGTVTVEAPGGGPAGGADLPGEVEVTDDDGTPNTCTDATLAATATPGVYAFACDVDGISVGTKTLTATYTDAGGDYATDDDTETHEVVKGTVTVTLSSDHNPSTYGDTVTFTAALSETDATGDVEFFDGTTSLGTCTLVAGTCDLDVATLAVGSHAITAEYPGDDAYDAATSNEVTQVVNPIATALAVTTAPNPSVYGQVVTVHVEATPATATGDVTVQGIGTCTLVAGACDVTTDDLTAGAWVIRAYYPGDATHAAVWGRADHVVTPLTIPSADIHYTGQTEALTASSSQTTSQVLLGATISTDAFACTGDAPTVEDAVVTFVDDTTLKVLARNVPLVQVGDDCTQGTATALATLSSGKTGAETYVIRVVLGGSLAGTNADQPLSDKTLTVSQPVKLAGTVKAEGGLAFLADGVPAGTITRDLGTEGTLTGAMTASDEAYVLVDLAYGKKSTPKGQVFVSLPGPSGSTYYLKGNSLSSVVTSGGVSTIVAKASLAQVSGNSVSSQGTVNIRIDLTDGSWGGGVDTVAVTIQSTKGSTLYYANHWVLDSRVWKTIQDLFDGTVAIV